MTAPGRRLRRPPSERVAALLGAARRGGRSRYLNGFAVANHSPMPVAMMNAPSSTPTSRNTFVCSGSISSGWRAADSRYLLPMMPMPMHDPIAPRPIMWPTASGRRLMPSMSFPFVQGSRARGLVDEADHRLHVVYAGSLLLRP